MNGTGPGVNLEPALTPGTVTFEGGSQAGLNFFDWENFSWRNPSREVDDVILHAQPFSAYSSKSCL